MPSASLPPDLSLVQLEQEASELRRGHRERRRSTAARIVAHLPRMNGQSLDSVLDRPLALADARLVVAREYGFDNWASLTDHARIADRIAPFKPNPHFDSAVAAMDSGDLKRLGELIASDRALVCARSNFDPPYGYFTGATLLHHVAGNPDRGRLAGHLASMPANVVEVARFLLDSGADVHALTLGPNPCDTMGLLITSKQASDAGASGPLIDLLLERGAKLDLKKPGALDAPLANHAPRAAERMIELGAKPDVLAAAALGRIDFLSAAFDGEGRLRVRPRRRGKTMTEPDAIGLAMLFAYVREQSDALDFLIEKDGNWNMIGVNNGTALHRAAGSGDLAMVKRLVKKGADLSNRNNPFTATPLSWAYHGKQDAVCQWIRAHCDVDLHDAVSFDLREHVEARLREDPKSVDMRIDHWQVPQSTPLFWAAMMNREQVAKLLLERGADPNILAGNGLTALDVALEKGAAGIVMLIEQNGGQRSADL
jgi:ankyrin repeat protein